MLSITQETSGRLLQSKTHTAHESAFLQDTCTCTVAQGLQRDVHRSFIHDGSNVETSGSEPTKQLSGHTNEEILLSDKEEKNQGHTQRHAWPTREPC